MSSDGVYEQFSSQEQFVKAIRYALPVAEKSPVQELSSVFFVNGDVWAFDGKTFVCSSGVTVSSGSFGLHHKDVRALLQFLTNSGDENPRMYVNNGVTLLS